MGREEEGCHAGMGRAALTFIVGLHAQLLLCCSPSGSSHAASDLPVNCLGGRLIDTRDGDRAPIPSALKCDSSHHPC